MWKETKAPSLAEMEAMAHEVFERLPEGFRTLCAGVIIRVDDFPTDEVLDEMQAQSEFDLLGLFQGIGLPHQSHGDIARLPNMIWLYRRPILDYWAEHEETLGHIVRHVLIHEIGHHFGLSDADREAIDGKVHHTGRRRGAPEDHQCRHRHDHSEAVPENHQAHRPWQGAFLGT